LGGVGFLTTLGVGVGQKNPTPDVQLDSFLHHSPKLGIPVEMVQFLLKLLLKQSSCNVPRFPLSASCYKIADSQTSFALYEVIGPENFEKGRSPESKILAKSKVDIRPPTPQPCFLDNIKF